MKNSRQRLTNMTIILLGAVLASGVFVLVSGEQGWLKFIGWTVFFTAILSPYFFAKDSGWNCFLFSRSKK